MKAGWRSVLTICGVLCVITPGGVLMPPWCVDNWDTLMKVSKHAFKCLKKHLQICLMYLDAVAFSNAHFGTGAGPIHLDNIGCNGSESKLIDCPWNLFGSCYYSHREVAGVRCQSTLVCVECLPFCLSGSVHHIQYSSFIQ